MNTNDLSTRASSAFAKARDLARTKPHAAMATGLGVVLAIAGVAGLAHHTSGHAPATAKAPTDAPSAQARVTPPAITAVPRHAEHARVPAAAASSLPPPVAVQPPAGLVAGRVKVTRFARDQFDRFVPVSTSTEAAQSVVAKAPQGSSRQPTRVEWTAWIKSAVPTSIAQVGVTGHAGTIAVSVDGAPLGKPYKLGIYTAPSEADYAATLAAGWHRVTVTDTIPAKPVGGPATVQVSLGDGVHAPTSPVPWAVLDNAEKAPAKASPKAPTSAPTKTPTSAGNAPADHAARAGGRS